ncbi:glycoside hydrolase family 97 protein [Crateriforma conspicua]|nr:glycoside hydrolase family 97 protein [Crateriforma conspicua]
MRSFATACCILCLCLVPTIGQAIEVTSPDGLLRAEFVLESGVPRWTLFYGGQQRLESGRLGLGIAGHELGMLEQVSASVSEQNEAVKTTWGKFAQYQNHYRQLDWKLRESSGDGREIQVIARVFNSGIGIRYAFGRGWDSSIDIRDDLTEFRFTKDDIGWAYNREHDPVGPQPLRKFHQAKTSLIPLVVRCSDGVHLSVVEAAIYDHAPFTLTALPSNVHGFRARMAPSKITRDTATSWRVVLVGRSAGDLLVSPVLFCLNPPCKISDTSWIKPGLAMWDWRAWGAKVDDGFTYGLDMPSWRRFIDFASRRGVSYLVLDAGWYGLEFKKDSDPKTSRNYLLVQPDPDSPRLVPKPAPADWQDPIDIPELIRYAREKNVGILLYFNDLARDHGSFEETLALYRQWGAAGIKYGFMKGDGQQKVVKTRQIVQLCAKYQLLCDFHDGPVPPSGDRRTWPNYVSREFCHAQSDAMRSFTPSTFCEQVFVNMVAGPLDMCNGLFTLNNPAQDRPKIFENVPSTVVAETARTLIVFSGLSFLPDCPEAYESKADLFQFLGQLPMTWDETRILDGEIGEYIVSARRSGSEWFIGSATNEESRTLEIKLDFLDPDTSYQVTLYEDADDAHYLHRREDYQVRQTTAHRGDVLHAKLAPGGGHCIHLTRSP